MGPTGKVYAEDISDYGLKTLLSLARERGLNNIVTLIGAQNDPQFPAGIFDMIFFHATFYYLKNPDLFLRNLLPNLKPGGKVVLIEMEKKRVPAPFATRQEFLDIFKKAGLKAERIDDTTDPLLTLFLLSADGPGGNGGVQLIDARDPRRPRPISRVRLDDGAFGVFVEGDTARPRFLLAEYESRFERE